MRSDGAGWVWLGWGAPVWAGEVDPELGARAVPLRVKHLMVGNQQHVFRSQRDDSPGVGKNRMTRLEVVVKPPEGAEYAGIVPVRTRRDIARLVEKERVFRLHAQENVTPCPENGLE